MKLWVDDVRPAPEGYVWCKSVNQAKDVIARTETRVAEIMAVATNRLNALDLRAYQSILKIANRRDIELIDIDHDAGDYAKDGGDYIRLLDWLEETGRNYPIRIHSANPVGVQNMRRIIERNGWKEIK
jgi:hypothetical protein